MYVSLACPWAHRTLITRKLLGLEEHVPVSVVHWFMGKDGWTFEPGPGVVADPDGASLLREVYARAKSDFTGRVTVPILWDCETGRIVNAAAAKKLVNTTLELGGKSSMIIMADADVELTAINDAPIITSPAMSTMKFRPPTQAAVIGVPWNSTSIAMRMLPT